jgi:hypothetical protein
VKLLLLFGGQPVAKLLSSPDQFRLFSKIFTDGHDMSVSGHGMSTYKGEGIVCAFDEQTK